MTQLTARTGVSDTYPLPSNAAAKAALAAMYDVLNESTQEDELDLASAATTNIGGQLSRKLRITGTTGITSFGTVYTGPIIIRFSAALTITHNATSLICPGGVNLTVAADDVIVVSPKATVSGTFDGWVILARPESALNLKYAAIAGSASQDFAARKLVQAAGADIASAATVDLSTATGSSPRITGTTTTSAVTMSTGQWCLVVADAAWPLTYNATTNKINTGGANVTLSAGDLVLYHKDLSGVVHGTIFKADGSQVTSPTLSSLTNSLGADVALNNTALYFDGPSVAQGTSGTWFASGTVTWDTPAGGDIMYAKLWDGTTVIASCQINSSNLVGTVSLSGYITSPAGNLRISMKNISRTTGNMRFNASGDSKDSTITAIRIG